MQRRFPSLMVFVALFWVPAAGAQSAENIIDRHLKALGGKKAVQSISSVRVAGIVTRSGDAGAPGEFLWQAKAPGSFYLELHWPGAHFIEGCNGRSAWRDDGDAGPRTLSGREQARARATARFRNDRFLSYKKEQTKVRLAGRDTVGGRTAYVIEMTTRTGLQRKFCFDTENYLLLKEEEEREGGREEIFFSDYRVVDGVKEPFRIRIQRGAELLDLSAQEVKHNSGVDDIIFDFPRKSEPLPEIAALLKAVEENQKKLEEARENYTYSVAETNLEIDDKGAVQQKSEEEFEVFYVHGHSLRKQVKRNGRELSTDDQRKEQERVEKRIREIEKRYKEEEEKKKKEQARPAKQKPKGHDEDDDDVTVSDFLRISQITNPRRERFRGKNVIVFEFSPRPGYKARNRAESVIQKLAGMIWVDEDAKEVVRLEAQTTDSVRVAGGLVASLGRG